LLGGVVRNGWSHAGLRICDPAATFASLRSDAWALSPENGEIAMRLLLVEDHEFLAEMVAGGLRREGMAVDVAHDGRDALTRSRVIPYDVIVLDRDTAGI
jgi:PleD family two-component response regulator